MNRFARISLAIASVVAIGVTGVSSAFGTDPPPPGDASSPGSGISAQTISTPDAGNEFHPLTPCRIVDGRLAGGPVPAETARSYEVRGTTGFVPQGGRSGGCGIPVSASAVAMTITVVSPTHAGFLRVWPSGQSEPTATLLNYGVGQSVSTTAPITLGPLSQPKDITVRPHAGSAQLVIDVQGYYEPQIQARVGIFGGIDTGTPRVLSATNTSTGNYTVIVDRDISACAINSNPNGSGGYIINTRGSGNTILAFAYSLAGTPTDILWQFSVHC